MKQKTVQNQKKNCQGLPHCPRIDVFMPGYNAEKYLRVAVNSILKQTYANWRLFACDDASTDNSWQILKEFAAKDKRIRVMRNKVNIKNGRTCAKLLDHCTSQYIAKMDADDISLPDRFAKELAFLQKNPDVIAVGGQCLLIDRKGKVFGEKKFLTDPEKVYQSMFTTVPAQFPSVMFQTGMVAKGTRWYQGLHDSVTDDVGLFFSLTKYGKITNLPDYVLKYRIHDKNSTLVDPKTTFKLTFAQRVAAITQYNYKPTWKGWVINLIQWVAVTVVPNKLIVPLFYFTKGAKIG